MAVDQTVYEGGDGFPENLKTDDDLLRQRVIPSLTFIWQQSNIDILKVETYIDGINDIFTSTILESPPHHQIYFRQVFFLKTFDGYHKQTQRNHKFFATSFVGAICDDHLMILDAPRLAEVRRLENFLDGCQNRVGCCFHCKVCVVDRIKSFFQGVVLSQFSKAVNSGDFCLAHLLTKRLETV